MDELWTTGWMHELWTTGWMDELWTTGWMDELWTRDEWMNYRLLDELWTTGWMDELWTTGWMHELWITGWTMDYWMNGRTVDYWMNGWTINYWMNVWIVRQYIHLLWPPLVFVHGTLKIINDQTNIVSINIIIIIPLNSFMKSSCLCWGCFWTTSTTDSFWPFLIPGWAPNFNKLPATSFL